MENLIKLVAWLGLTAVCTSIIVWVGSDPSDIDRFIAEIIEAHPWARLVGIGCVAVLAFLVLIFNDGGRDGGRDR